MLTFADHDGDPFLRWFLRLVGDRYGLEFTAAGGREADLGYGDSSPGRLRIPRHGPPDPGAIPLPGRLPEAAGPVFPFDVVSAVRFWVADEANASAPPVAFDRHERLTGEGSRQGELGILDVPPVNAYLDLFAGWLERSLPGLQRGREPQACLVLTHDADNPIDLHDPTHAAWRARRALKNGQPLRAAVLAASAAQRTLRHLRGQRRRHWTFPELMELEAANGVRSSIYFSARSRGEAATCEFDEAYDVRDPRFKRLFHELGAGGWEVGLHASYLARERPSRIRQERERLEAAAGTAVLGNRHHYWHMGRPFWSTLDAHAAAGLQYDCSVAFNEVPGYRLGLAMAFRPWNPVAGRPVEAWQLPTVLMDGAYFYRPELTVDSALADFDRVLDELVRARGTAAINWHVRWCVPVEGEDPRWGIAYREMLSMIRARPGLRTATTAEALGLADFGGGGET